MGRTTGELGGFRRASERAWRTGQGVATVVMFLLVPQVEIPTQLDVACAAERWLAKLPALADRQIRAE